MQFRFPHSHLLGTDQLTADDISVIFTLAEKQRKSIDSKQYPPVSTPGLRVVLAFFEDSTRTRVSFEKAAQRIGAECVVFSASGSSVSKGESLTDTMLTLEAMGTDVFVVRHREDGVIHDIANTVNASCINAGDGRSNHPTQALLDAFSLYRAGVDFRGFKVGILGDVKHSRVARSNVQLLQTLGAECFMYGPPELMPEDDVFKAVQQVGSINELVECTDAVIVLRIQKERMQETVLSSLSEYAEHYCLQPKHLQHKPDLHVLHPGPMNREIEIATAVADGPNSLILEQVRNGVAIRMALLNLLGEWH